ncbi:MAG: helix-turn-helix domain-containing protein [Firmicutes bacterium]|nr:helix-turn-helix domain-containing protein [Bacillota bacterium]
MNETVHLSINDTRQILSIARALSSEQRLNILKLLEDKILNISEIAARLQIPMSTAALHIKTLEEAGLVITQPLPGIRGSQKLSGVRVEKVFIDLKPAFRSDSPIRTIYYSVPIGNYFDFQITAPCGIASEKRFLSATDEASVFYLPDRGSAQILWFTEGYLEYRVSTTQLRDAASVESVEFSFEACSEAQGYNNDWPSDITLWLNRQEVGTFTSEGDFGGVRGARNPLWWPEDLTQYGKLYRLYIDQTGSYINGERVSGHTPATLGICENDVLLFRIGIKPDAKFIGGLNLFGEHFGNHAQHINVKINFTPANR